MSFRDDALAGQHILISGGCGGIGVEVIRKLTSHGAMMTVNDLLPPTQAHDVLGKAGASSKNITYLQGDLTRPEQCEALVRHARQTFGPVHTVLCHAGIVMGKPILDFTEAEWDQILDTNVKSAFLLAKASAAAMLEDGIKGLLVFTTSWVSDVPWPEIGPYTASKAAMKQLMRSFARELAPRGIRANAVSPGIVGVGMARRQWDTDPSYKARAQKAIPLGSLQSAESVADAMLFLCSPASSYMTGSVLLVDGGCSLYPMD